MKAVLFDGYAARRTWPSLGAVGDLVIDESGITWIPGRLARCRRRPAKRIKWDEVQAADIVAAWGRGRPSRLLTVRTTAEEIVFSLGDLDAEEVGTLLARYLETR